MATKTCVKCKKPIGSPQLATKEPERCASCGDPGATTRTRTQHFSKQQIKDFVKQAKRPWGEFAWRQLGNELREGLIAAVVVGVVTGQSAEHITILAVRQLIDDMRQEAGLYTPGW